MIMTEKKRGTQTEKWNEVDGSASGKYLEAFLDSESDGYAIMQLKRGEESIHLRFMSYDAIEQQGQRPEINFYDVVYANTLELQIKDSGLLCDYLYIKFNVDRPDDFEGHSLSVSDVIALKRQGEVNCYYVDAVGFRELQDFNLNINPLRGVENLIEQNDNQLDGVINNLPEETLAGKESKSSVIEKLKVSVLGLEKYEKSSCCDRELC